MHVLFSFYIGLFPFLSISNNFFNSLCFLLLFILEFYLSLFTFAFFNFLKKDNNKIYFSIITAFFVSLIDFLFSNSIKELSHLRLNYNAFLTFILINQLFFHLKKKNTVKIKILIESFIIISLYSVIFLLFASLKESLIYSQLTIFDFKNIKLIYDINLPFKFKTLNYGYVNLLLFYFMSIIINNFKK